MSITPLSLTGVSSYSTDLQNVLNRAVQIAQLPLTALQNQDTDALQRKALVGNMSAPLTALGSAVQALGTLASNQGLSASSSNASLVSVTNTGSSIAAQYTISNITSVAAAASETSKISYPDSNQTNVSSTGSMELVVGSKTYNFDLAKNNLAGLRDKINSLNAGVSASILTTGNGNYLSVTANNTGKTTLQLIDDPAGAATNVLTSANQGVDAKFTFNGIAVSRPSNTVNDLVAGLTFKLLAPAPASTVTLSLSSDRSQLSTALANFASAYNAVADQVNAQVGQNAGLLSGDFLVRQIRENLTQLGSYQAAGGTQSLSDLGIVFDVTGKMSFNQSTFDSLSDSQVAGGFQFFGSKTTGFGSLAKNFTALTDPVSGLLRLQEDSYDATDRRLQKQITDLTTRINAMQTALSRRLSTADTLLASLETQKSQVTASVSSLNYVLYGKQTSSN